MVSTISEYFSKAVAYACRTPNISNSKCYAIIIVTYPESLDEVFIDGRLVLVGVKLALLQRLYDDR